MDYFSFYIDNTFITSHSFYSGKLKIIRNLLFRREKKNSIKLPFVEVENHKKFGKIAHKRPSNLK